MLYINYVFRKMKSIKIIVTGGAGYVGSVLVGQLLKKNFHVTIYDNLTYGGNHLIHFFSYKNFEFIKGDIRDTANLKRAIKDKDIIIHLAAIVGYPACSKDPKLANDINFLGTKKLLELRTGSQAVFFASTGSNYGSIDEICTEETKVNPLTTYAKTKDKAENLVTEKKNYIAYRFATAYGSSPRMRLDLMINDFIYKLITQNYLVVYEKKFMRTFLHIQDIGRSFIHGIENFNSMKNNIFNVGNEKLNFSKEQVCNQIMKKVKGYVYFAEIGSDKDKRNYYVSYDKIRKTGFKNKYSLEYGIDELIKTINVIETRKNFSNI